MSNVLFFRRVAMSKIRHSSLSRVCPFWSWWLVLNEDSKLTFGNIVCFVDLLYCVWYCVSWYRVKIAQDTHRHSAQWHMSVSVLGKSPALSCRAVSWRATPFGGCSMSLPRAGHFCCNLGLVLSFDARLKKTRRESQTKTLLNAGSLMQ